MRIGLILKITGQFAAFILSSYSIIKDHGGEMSGKIEIKPVTDKKMMMQFIKLPWTAKIYENDPGSRSP
ncbi:MAG: hypothetical protein MUD12_11650 [Spirochaetes bacterium]|nr:hypothetical protein [Spirochaetota bacterium]